MNGYDDLRLIFERICRIWAEDKVNRYNISIPLQRENVPQSAQLKHIIDNQQQLNEVKDGETPEYEDLAIWAKCWVEYNEAEQAELGDCGFYRVFAMGMVDLFVPKNSGSVLPNRLITDLADICRTANVTRSVMSANVVIRQLKITFTDNTDGWYRLHAMVPLEISSQPVISDTDAFLVDRNQVERSLGWELDGILNSDNTVNPNPDFDYRAVKDKENTDD